MGDGRTARSYLTRYAYSRHQGLPEPSARTATEPFLTERPHRGLTHLPSGSCLELGTVLPLRQQRSCDEVSRPTRLATLLQNTLGLMRYEVGSPRPFHRGAPSPRCLYASELYVCLLEDGWGATGGAYRYNPLRHALEKKADDLRAREQLAEALGGGESEGGVAQDICAAIVVGAEFWRIARYYSDFAFHLAVLECGQVVGQLELLSDRLGWSVEVVECFWEQPLLELLGLDPLAETALTVVLLRDRTGRSTEVPIAADETELATCEPESFPSIPSKYREEILSCQDLQAILQASRYRSVEEIPSRSRFVSVDSPASAVQPPTNGRSIGDLSEAIWQRSSGNDALGLSHRAQPLRGVAAKEFWQALTGEIATLARGVGIELYLAVHAVEGVETGFYRGAELITASKRVGSFLADVSTVSERILNPRQLPLSIFLAADFPSLIHAYGDRGYQMAVVQSGRVAQWVSLLASGLGFWARTLKSYDDARLEAELGLVHNSLLPVCQLAVGEHSIPFLSFDLRI